MIVVRRGLHVRVAATLRKRDLMQTAGRILRVARETAADGAARPTIVVDEIGVGGGLVDRLRETREFPVAAFNASGKARDPREYPNARSQAWFDFAEQLPDLDLDDDEQLAAELVAPIYRIDSAGRRSVEAKAETKRRLGRSPDRADAVLMAYAVAPRRYGSTHVPRGRIGASRRGRYLAAGRASSAATSSPNVSARSASRRRRTTPRTSPPISGSGDDRGRTATADEGSRLRTGESDRAGGAARTRRLSQKPSRVVSLVDVQIPSSPFNQAGEPQQ